MKVLYFTAQVQGTARIIDSCRYRQHQGTYFGKDPAPQEVFEDFQYAAGDHVSAHKC